MGYVPIKPDGYEKLPWEAQVKLNQFGSRWIGTRKFGSNLDVGTSFEDVWSVGGSIGFLSAADNIEVLSDSTDDDGDPGGTGARTITIQGLDGDWKFLEETVTMDGTSVVTTSGSFLRVYRAFVATAGTGLTNAGNITIRDATGDTTQAYISAGDGQTLQAIFTTREAHYGYITNLQLSIGGADVAQCELRTRTDGQGFRVKDQEYITAGNSNIFPYAQFGAGILVPPKTDILVRAKKVGAGGTTSVTASFNLFEIKEDEIRT